MFNDFLLKQSINKYLRQLNNNMLKKYYINASKKNPKTHTDNIVCMCCVNEMKKRGLVI